MKYVLLTHIPTFAGQSPEHIRWSSDWMSDLLADPAVTALNVVTTPAVVSICTSSVKTLREVK